MAEKKNLGGRPSKYSDLDLRQVKELTKRGWTDEQMSDFFQVSRSTWSLWKTKHKEFSDILTNWKALADQEVEKTLLQKALGYQDEEGKIYPPDTTSIIFWLKNRQPAQWRDKQDHSLTVEDVTLIPRKRPNEKK